MLIIVQRLAAHLAPELVPRSWRRMTATAARHWAYRNERSSRTSTDLSAGIPTTAAAARRGKSASNRGWDGCAYLDVLWPMHHVTP
jgi:hypothetical protein